MNLWFVLACSLVVIFVLSKRKNNKYKNLPPGPPSLPIIGNLHQIGSLPHRSFHRFSRQYGSLFSLKLGRVPTVVASSPDTASQLLKTHDINCCTRPALSVPGRLSYNYIDLSFAPYNEYYRELRKICTLELYSAKRVQSFKNVRHEEVASFVDSVNESALTQTPFKYGKKLLSLSGNFICRIGFGINLRDSAIGKDGYEDLITGAMGMLGSFALADFFPYVGWIMDRLSGLHARKEKIFHSLDKFYEQAIELHLNKNKEEGEDIIDVLLKIEKEQSGLGGFRLTRDHIKGILMDILLAGIDTSAITMEWVMTRLMANPRVLKKVQAEIRNHIKHKDTISEESIEQLEYLKMVLKETFRLHPLTAIMIPRQAMTDIKINDYIIPAKTRIEINLWAIGHDPEIWKDPEEFIPERFLNSEIDYKGQNFELLPFGSGRRMCPGMNMGLSLVYMTLINILYRFDWKLPEGMSEKDVSFEEKFGVVVGRKTPLQIIPIRTQWT